MRYPTFDDLAARWSSGMNDVSTSDKELKDASHDPGDGQKKGALSTTRGPSIVVGTIAAVVVALSVYYLLRPEPLLVQGEADATRFDIPHVSMDGSRKYLSNAARMSPRGLFSCGST